MKEEINLSLRNYKKKWNYQNNYQNYQWCIFINTTEHKKYFYKGELKWNQMVAVR